MEQTKYLCEFFFADFWHWLGLFLIVAALFNQPFIKINKWKSLKKDFYKDKDVQEMEKE